MSRLREQEIGDFITKLASRYEAYTRNKARDEQTGKEVIIPVSENAKAREEIQRTIDELCVLYLTVSDEGRNHVRKLVQAHRPLHNGLLAHIGWTAQHKPPDWLRRGLAAASIEDNRVDFRDMFIALGGLYLEAVAVGLDVSDCFQKAAQLSSAVAGPYFKLWMREFLAGFEQSEYFKQSVRPKLPTKRIQAGAPQAACYGRRHPSGWSRQEDLPELGPISPGVLCRCALRKRLPK
jgi:hypothetical protein